METTNLTKRESNKINCRERILKASRRLFTSKGYEETMMEDIAQRAEVSKATVYNYFPNKESLLIGTVSDVMDEAENDLAAAAGSGSEMKLRRVMSTFIRASMKYPSLARRISYLSSCADSALYGTGRRMFHMLRGLILAAQAEGTFRRDADPDDIVDILMGLYYIAQFQWPDIDHYTDEMFRRKLDAFFSMMMDGFYVR